MKTACFLLPLLLVASCGSPDDEIIKVDFEKFGDTRITLSEIADDITYVPLDNDYPMSIYFLRAEIFNDTIYLLEKDNGMFALDMSGKMVRKYGSRGRGPGEYVYGFRFTIDRDNRILYLLDAKNILIYSLAGTYMGNISLEKNPGHFTELRFRDSLLMAFEFIAGGESVYDWIVIDTAGNPIMEKYNSVPSFKTNYGVPGGVYEYENTIQYWNSINDTVYSISPDLTYKTSLLFIPSELRYPRYDHTIGVKELNKYINLSLVLETDRFIVLRYFYKESALVLIDKGNRQTYRVTWLESNGGLLNDLDGGVPFEPKQYFREDGIEYLIGYTQPVNILTRLRTDDFRHSVPRYPAKKEALVKMSEKLKETDNALLTIVRLKK